MDHRDAGPRHERGEVVERPWSREEVAQHEAAPQRVQGVALLELHAFGDDVEAVRPAHQRRATATPANVSAIAAAMSRESRPPKRGSA